MRDNREIHDMDYEILKLARARFGASAVPGLRLGTGAYEGKLLLVLLDYHNPRIVALADDSASLLEIVRREAYFTDWCQGCQCPIGHPHRPYCSTDCRR